MNTLAIVLLCLGLVGSVIAFAGYLRRWYEDGLRDVALCTTMAFSILCLTLAVFAQRAERNGKERIATEPNRTEQVATERSQAEGIATERLGWTPTQEERYAAVYAAVGPPPTDDAVPVLGYETKGGAKYPPRWRTPPDGERENNFKNQGQ